MPGQITEWVLATAKTAKSGTTCTATVGDTDVTVQVARDLTVAALDTILIGRVGSQWFVVQRYYTAPATLPDNDPAPPPKPDVKTGTLVVSPVETRSYRNTFYVGWNMDTTDVYQGEYGGNGLYTGCVFYGSKPRSLAGATVQSATFRVRRLTGGTYAAQASTMRLMTNSVRPGGAPTLTSSATGPRLAVNTTFDTYAIPASWAQQMVDGTAGGIAFYVAGGSPYIRFAGRNSWSAAFTLSIKWQRG